MSDEAGVNKDKEEKVKVDPNRPENPTFPNLGELTRGFSTALNRGLKDLAEYLDNLAEAADNMRARSDDPDATKGSPPPRRYQSGTAAANRARPVAPRPAPARPGTANTPPPKREPIVDIFDEQAEGVIQVVAELPGVAENSIKVEVEGDILVIKATSPSYIYEKECLLPGPVETAPKSRRYQNGVLEIKLKRIVKVTS